MPFKVHILIFAILVALPICLIATVVRLPKFSSEAQYGIVDDGLWSPSFSTSIRGLDSKFVGSNFLELKMNIEHLPDQSNFQMDLGVQCRPSDEEINVKYILPFTSHGETLCQSVFPFTLTTRQSYWATVDNQPKYILSLGLKRVPGAEPDFQETLTHRVRLRFSFHNTKWRLESNQIFLLSWDSAFKLHNNRKSGKSEPQYFLTDQSMDLMLNLNMPGTKPFEEIQFFELDLIKLMTDAPEFVRNYINIEAIMLLGVGVAATCHTSNAQYSIVFATRKADVIELHDKMLKVAQIDWKTGRMTFSRYGLSAAMTRFYEINRRTQNPHRPDDYRLRICAGIELSHSYKPVSSFKTVDLIKNPKLGYKILGSLHDDCQIIEPSSRQVTMFARSGKNWLICPIICSNMEEPYLFYKGSFALTPQSTQDKTSYFKDAIFALKAGTVIELREDLTYEDEGLYSCTAGKHRASINLRVVSMPHFTMSMLNGKKLIGNLPNKIYAVEGDGYSVSCTVYFTGIESVTLVPEFYMKSYSPDGTLSLTKVLVSALTSETKPAGHHYRTNISMRSTKYSQTITLTVEDIKMNISEGEYLFNHRFVCDASTAAADSLRYGMTEYRVQSGADVLFVPRLRANSFTSNLIGCCLETSCSEKCSIEVTLKPELRSYFASIGVSLDAVFTRRGAPYNSAEAVFDPVLVKIVYSLPGSLGAMTEEPRSDFLAVQPVIRSRYSREAALFDILRSQSSDIGGDAECSKNPNCLFSTGFEVEISKSLTPGGIISEWVATRSLPIPSWLPRNIDAVKVTPDALTDKPKDANADSVLC